MASPKSPASQSPTPSRSVRRFTLELANRSLPLVRRIVQDIVVAHAAASDARDLLQRSTGRDAADAQHSLDASVQRLERLVDELSDIGVELKDYQSGLVDFVG